ncbi:MAG TPA: LamG-like jellyroll fold domain-containing protein [Polyangia bacterium]|nr:LamG-like jellyroll fold domain-containing protein [Polyangia bacterium]
MNKRFSRVVVSAATILLVGCSGGSSSKPDSGVDSRPDVQNDVRADLLPATGGRGGGGAGGTNIIGVGGMPGAGGVVGIGGNSPGTGGMTGVGGQIQVDAGVDTFPPRTTCAGYAMRFSGSFSYLTIDRSVQDDFTLEVWIRTSTPSTTGANFWQGTPVIYADLAGTHNDFGTSILNNHFSFGLGVLSIGGDQSTEGTSVVTTGQWVHLAATRTLATGNIQVFVNGVLENARVTGNMNALSDNPIITIGGNNVDGRYFTGDMDELRIWNFVRTGAEINATMRTRVFGDEPGLVGYWRFDDPGAAMPMDTSLSRAIATPTSVDWVPSDAPVCPGSDAGAPDVPANPDGGPIDAPVDAPMDAPQDGPATTDAPAPTDVPPAPTDATAGETGG